MYDYGKDENHNKYGTKDPPEYALSNIRAPLAFFYSENDALADPLVNISIIIIFWHFYSNKNIKILKKLKIVKCDPPDTELLYM